MYGEQHANHTYNIPRCKWICQPKKDRLAKKIEPHPSKLAPGWLSTDQDQKPSKHKLGRMGLSQCVRIKDAHARRLALLLITTAIAVGPQAPAWEPLLSEELEPVNCLHPLARQSHPSSCLVPDGSRRRDSAPPPPPRCVIGVPPCQPASSRRASSPCLSPCKGAHSH